MKTKAPLFWNEVEVRSERGEASQKNQHEVGNRSNAEKSFKEVLVFEKNTNDKNKKPLSFGEGLG